MVAHMMPLAEAPRNFARCFEVVGGQPASLERETLQRDGLLAECVEPQAVVELIWGVHYAPGLGQLGRRAVGARDHAADAQHRVSPFEDLGIAARPSGLGEIQRAERQLRAPQFHWRVGAPPLRGVLEVVVQDHSGNPPAVRIDSQHEAAVGGRDRERSVFWSRPGTARGLQQVGRRSGFPRRRRGRSRWNRGSFRRIGRPARFLGHRSGRGLLLARGAGRSLPGGGARGCLIPHHPQNAAPTEQQDHADGDAYDRRLVILHNVISGPGRSLVRGGGPERGRSTDRGSKDGISATAAAPASSPARNHASGGQPGHTSNRSDESGSRDVSGGRENAGRRR